MRFRLSRSLCRFQHTATRRRLGRRQLPLRPAQGFNTQPPEGSWANCNKPIPPKTGFNTQPPEGGWESHQTNSTSRHRFNTQPPEGGWRLQEHTDLNDLVSTHSRPKAAGLGNGSVLYFLGTFQHTAARRRLGQAFSAMLTRTQFQHTAARRRLASGHTKPSSNSRFNTQPPEGGWMDTVKTLAPGMMFQHTAARRRLGPLSKALLHQVSQT